MARLEAALARLVFAAAAVGFLSFSAAALVTVADIVARRTGLAVPGVVDLVQLFVLAGAWCVMPYAFLHGAHVSVDLLLQAVSERLRAVLRLVGNILTVALLLPMSVEAYQAFEVQRMFGDRSQQIGIPIAWYWAPVLAGLFLSTLAAMWVLAGALTPRRRP